MPLWAWVLVGTSAGVFLVLAVSTTAFVVVHGLRLWRRITALEKSVGMPLEELVVRLETLDTRAQEASDRAADAERRVAELRDALAKMGVLSWALGEARDALGFWRAVTRR